MDLPRWNLNSIYPSFDSPEYQNDIQSLREQILELERFVQAFEKEPSVFLMQLIRAWERACDTAENLDSYAQAVYTADTRNEQALKEINSIETLCLPLKAAVIGMQKLLYTHSDPVLSLLDAKEYEHYRFFVKELIFDAAHLMTQAEEDLEADLARSGADSWSRLHEAISSNLAVWYEGEKKTVTALRELAFSPDRKIRESAYKAEIEAWKSVEIPLAACLNGVKGWAVSIDGRRSWKTSLEKSAFQNRLDPCTLEVLISTIE